MAAVDVVTTKAVTTAPVDPVVVEVPTVLVDPMVVLTLAVVVTVVEAVLAALEVPAVTAATGELTAAVVLLATLVRPVTPVHQVLTATEQMAPVVLEVNRAPAVLVAPVADHEAHISPTVDHFLSLTTAQ